LRCSRMHAMAEDFPISPDTGWGTEILQLMEDRGYDFDEACARVMARFLNAGDTRPYVICYDTEGSLVR